MNFHLTNGMIYWLAVLLGIIMGGSAMVLVYESLPNQPHLEISRLTDTTDTPGVNV